MTIFSSILILVVNIMILSVIYRDLMLPAILVKIPWLVALSFLSLSGYDYDSNNVFYLYYAIGLLMFDLGFIFIAKTSTREKKENSNDVLVNHKLIKFVMGIEFVVIVYYCIIVFSFVKRNFVYNFYYSLKLGSVTGSFVAPFFMGYFINFVVAFTSLIIYISFLTKNTRKRILISQLLLGLVSVLLTLGRTSVFLFAILNLFFYLILNNIEKRKVMKYFLIGITIGIIFFTSYNLLKYPYTIEYNNILSIAFDGIIGYLTGSLVAFQKWASESFELIYGLNIFRFFFAIFDRLGYQINLQSLVNPFINISNDHVTNVYTIYYYYAKDFGLFAALIMQIFYGILHGYLYTKMHTSKPIWIYLFSLSLYPLFMQFFQDQYISLTSTWLQFILYGVLFFKTDIFVKKLN